MELGLRRITRLVASRGVGIRCRRQDERRGRLKLMLERRLFGRAARQGRAVGARGVYGLKIILGEQVERAEELVVFEVEGASSLKVAAEGN